MIFIIKKLLLYKLCFKSSKDNMKIKQIHYVLLIVQLVSELVFKPFNVFVSVNVWKIIQVGIVTRDGMTTLKQFIPDFIFLIK